MKKYYVTLVGKTDETVILKTDSKDEAIVRAKDEKHYIERDHRKDSVEIRVYADDIENDDCVNFDYDTIEF